MVVLRVLVYVCDPGPLGPGLPVFWTSEQQPHDKKNKHKANRGSAERELLLADALPHSVSLFVPSGETVLHRAASLCHRTICHYLVEAGASLMKTDLQVDASLT